MHTTIAKSSAPVPAVTLETWTAHDWSHGVLLSHLAPHDRLIVRTRNSTYEIVVMVPDIASVMVRGGAFFPTSLRRAWPAARWAAASSNCTASTPGFRWNW